MSIGEARPRTNSAAVAAAPRAAAPAPHSEAQPAKDLRQTLADVAQRIAPVWPLEDYVAVNPYLGLADHDWLAARRLLRSVSDAELLMPLAHYRQAYRAGAFSRDDIDAAIDELLRDGVPGADRLAGDAIVRRLECEMVGPASSGGTSSRPQVETLAAVVDRYTQGSWQRTVVDEVGKWCAAYYDRGQAAWPFPWADAGSLYAAWRAAAQHDRRVEWLGLRGFRAFVAKLPAQPDAAIAALLGQLQAPHALREKLLLCEAFSVLGWSAWTRRQEWEAQRRGAEGDDFASLLAIRLAYDVALAERHGIEVDWSTVAETSSEDAGIDEQALLRYCLLRASEIAYRRELLAKMATSRRESARAAAEALAERKLAQWVFCIDVRSERIRRALEASSPDVETAGFAGFFGVPMELVPWGAGCGSSHAPAPLKPQFAVLEGPAADASEETTLARRAAVRGWRQAQKAFQTSAASALGFVETSGWWYGLKMIKRLFAAQDAAVDPRFDGVAADDRPGFGPLVDADLPGGLTAEQQLDLAQSVLRNLQFAGRYARLVVLCGHASQTANNPLQAGLDCGACCGHSGEANARYAARLLNLPRVRAGLVARGVELPSDVHFVAAVHNTTTDELTFFDVDGLPESHLADWGELQMVARAATVATQLERAPLLDAADPADLVRRSCDWSEVRPEWGLAGNAALVAGPRSLTQRLAFDGRIFLHNYEASRDPEGAVLELIMTAPMVVTHWINMQYYASTVDPQRMGSGNKTIHNVVGRFGLLAGNGGDLLTGLPWQSLHDGAGWRHDPLRLQVVIAAPRTQIERIVGKHQLLQQLLSGGWLHLVAEEDGRFFRCTRRLAWLPLHVEPLAEAAIGANSSVSSHSRASHDHATRQSD